MTINPGRWWAGDPQHAPRPPQFPVPVMPSVEIHYWHRPCCSEHDPLHPIRESLKRIERALMTQSDDIAADTAAVLKNNAILADVLTAVDALKASGAPIPAQILADLDAAVAGNGSAASALQADVAPPAPPAP